MRKHEVVAELLSNGKKFEQLTDEWNNTSYTWYELIDTLNEMHDRKEISVEGDVLKYTGKLPKDTATDEKIQDALQTFEKIMKERPASKTEFYQEAIFPRDSFARIAFMKKRNDILNKKIFLIGDDDLLSVAIALCGYRAKITVVDIDEDLGKFLGKLGKEYGIDIEFQIYNISNPLPDNLAGKFDVFSTEPVETLDGIRAFLWRGALALKKEGAGYFGLSTIESPLTKWLDIEKIVLDAGFAITDVQKGFSTYMGDVPKWEKQAEENISKRLNFKVSGTTVCFKSDLIRIERATEIEIPNEKIEFDIEDEGAI